MVTKTLSAAEVPGRLKMSYEEYLEWHDEDVHAEWVDGEVIIHMPTKDEHQAILYFLSRLIGEFVELFDLGKVRFAPYEVKLWPGGPSREPDLFFLAKEHLGRLTSERLNGPPDLIVEIVSRDSVHRDRERKFHEYASAGVQEYWIIDSRRGRERADFYHLNEADRYELFATEDDERIESKVLPGFWLNPAWLWQEPKPDLIRTIVQLSPEAAAAIRSRLFSE